MTFFKNNAVKISIFFRVMVAVLGGYLLANLVAILISYLSSTNKVDAIVAGLMVSFIVYTAVVIYAFSAKSARRAALVVSLLSLITFGIITFLNKAPTL